MAELKETMSEAHSPSPAACQADTRFFPEKALAWGAPPFGGITG